MSSPDNEEMDMPVKLGRGVNDTLSDFNDDPPDGLFVIGSDPDDNTLAGHNGLVPWSS